MCNDKCKEIESEILANICWRSQYLFVDVYDWLSYSKQNQCRYDPSVRLTTKLLQHNRMSHSSVTTLWHSGLADVAPKLVKYGFTSFCRNNLFLRCNPRNQAQRCFTTQGWLNLQVYNQYWSYPNRWSKNDVLSDDGIW